MGSQESPCNILNISNCLDLIETYLPSQIQIKGNKSDLEGEVLELNLERQHLDQWEERTE